MHALNKSVVAGAIALLTGVAWGADAPGDAAAARSGAVHAGHRMDAEVAPAAPPPRIPNSVSGDILTGLPLTEPPVIRSRQGVLKVELTAMATPVRISGKLVNARVYAASAYGQSYPPAFAPPTLVVDPGDNLQVTLNNQLGEPTNLHTHGFFVSPMGNQDNIFVDLPSGSKFLYSYDLPKGISPGSYWYHPHFHPLVEEQVFGGLSGFIYVRGQESFLPQDLQDIKQRFLQLKDFQYDSGNTIPATNIDSNAATHRTVNGLVQPTLALRAGETQLWHLGNLGADIWYTLELSGLSFTVIGEDGNILSRPWTTTQLLMPPAKRFDVLVQAGTPGSYSLLTAPMDTGPAGDNYPLALLATLNVTGKAAEPAALPRFLKLYDNLSDAAIAKQRVFVLSENQNTNRFFINHRTFGANRVDATPETGTVEEWVFQNTTQELHPIHFHVNDIQVMSVNGVPQQARSLVDTVPIPYATTDAAGNRAPGEVVIRTRFSRFVGPYVFHCHILAHEDNGMMSIINVTSPGSE